MSGLAIPEGAALPLRSGKAYLTAIPAHRRHAVYAYILESAATAIPALQLQLPAESLPNYAVATTFVNVAEDETHNFLTTLTSLPERVDGEFVSDLTHTLGLERQTGLEKRSRRIRRAQDQLGPSAQLLAVTAYLGIRTREMRVQEKKGVIGMTYTGDGQILASVLNQDGTVASMSLVRITDPDWGVIFPSGSYDLRGDLGFLYSVLTAPDEELALLL